MANMSMGRSLDECKNRENPQMKDLLEASKQICNDDAWAGVNEHFWDVGPAERPKEVLR
jgi:hypothetical protein